MAPDFAAMCDPGLRAAHKSVRDVSVDFLRVNGLPQGTMTPRASWYIWAAALIRRGGHVGIGMENTQWLPREKLDRILALGDIELELEETRRKVAPEEASRLCALWVAEDSEAGESHVRAMLGPDVLVLRVSIVAAIRFTRVDTTWFDLYCQSRKAEYANKYWSGTACDRGPKWEFLVEGCIEAIDPEQLEYIRTHGAHLELKGKGQGPAEPSPRPYGSPAAGSPSGQA